MRHFNFNPSFVSNCSNSRSETTSSTMNGNTTLQALLLPYTEWTDIWGITPHSFVNAMIPTTNSSNPGDQVTTNLNLCGAFTKTINYLSGLKPFVDIFQELLKMIKLFKHRAHTLRSSQLDLWKSILNKKSSVAFFSCVAYNIFRILACNFTTGCDKSVAKKESSSHCFATFLALHHLLVNIRCLF